jgi:hypothetical protein
MTTLGALLRLNQIAGKPDSARALKTIARAAQLQLNGLKAWPDRMTACGAKRTWTDRCFDRTGRSTGDLALSRPTRMATGHPGR